MATTQAAIDYLRYLPYFSSHQYLILISASDLNQCYGTLVSCCGCYDNALEEMRDSHSDHAVPHRFRGSKEGQKFNAQKNEQIQPNFTKKQKLFYAFVR